MSEVMAIDLAGRRAVVTPHASVTGVAADLSTAVGATELIAKVPDADILINNVAIIGHTPLFDSTDEEWEYAFQLNVMTAVRLSRHRSWTVLFLVCLPGYFTGKPADQRPHRGCRHWDRRQAVVRTREPPILQRQSV